MRDTSNITPKSNMENQQPTLVTRNMKGYLQEMDDAEAATAWTVSTTILICLARCSHCYHNGMLVIWKINCFLSDYEGCSIVEISKLAL